MKISRKLLQSGGIDVLNIRLPDWKTEAILTQEVSELPPWFDATHLYLDCETTSEKDKVASTNPWHDCKLLGIAIVIDEERFPLYIPLRHRGSQAFKNLPLDPVIAWLKKVLKGTKNWINHNIKYDCHVLTNEDPEFEKLISEVHLIDTLAMCRLAPKEERFTYNLTDIMNEWFYINIEPYELDIHTHLKRGCKDYGLIPIDKMCPYAAVDTLCVRHIFKEIVQQIPEECNRVVELEQAVTPILLGIERNGLTLDMELVEHHYVGFPMILQAIVKELEKLTGFTDMRPHTNADCKSLICGDYGLPVLEWTEKKAPSFGSGAIRAYKAMRPDLSAVWDWILKYKEFHKLYTAFAKSYFELNIDGRIHSDYNQIVRTGRMSCRTPNAMQLSKAAKAYIIPSAPERVIVDIDFSQIEFRLIAHFIKAKVILQQYAEDPFTDYHTFVASLCHIARTPAKRINFMLGYGGGRGKCISILASEPEIIEELKDKDAIERRANEVYNRYHSLLPTLKPTTWEASRIMRTRGYVRTILGRRRYLPRKAHYKAFNTVVQGSAADLWKLAMVRVSEYIRDKPHIQLIAGVHDSFLFDMPNEVREEEVPKLIEIIEQIPEGINLRVPLRADAKWSNKNWRECEQ